MHNFEAIRKQFIEKHNLAALSREEQNEIFSEMRKAILEKVTEGVVGMLSAADRVAAKTLLDKGDSEAFLKFAEAKIPNLPYAVDSIALQVLKDKYGIE